MSDQDMLEAEKASAPPPAMDVQQNTGGDAGGSAAPMQGVKEEHPAGAHQPVGAENVGSAAAGSAGVAPKQEQQQPPQQGGDGVHGATKAGDEPQRAHNTPEERATRTTLKLLRRSVLEGRFRLFQESMRLLRLRELHGMFGAGSARTHVVGLVGAEAGVYVGVSQAPLAGDEDTNTLASSPMLQEMAAKLAPQFSLSVSVLRQRWAKELAQHYTTSSSPVLENDETLLQWLQGVALEKAPAAANPAAATTAAEGPYADNMQLFRVVTPDALHKPLAIEMPPGFGPAPENASVEQAGAAGAAGAAPAAGTAATAPAPASTGVVGGPWIKQEAGIALGGEDSGSGGVPYAQGAARDEAKAQVGVEAGQWLVVPVLGQNVWDLKKLCEAYSLLLAVLMDSAYAQAPQRCVCRARVHVCVCVLCVSVLWFRCACRHAADLALPLPASV